MKEFVVRAQYDADAGVWWGSNDELPVASEADSFDGLVARVMEIAPEIAEINGLVRNGEEVKIRFTADRTATVRA